MATAGKKIAKLGVKKATAKMPAKATVKKAPRASGTPAQTRSANSRAVKHPAAGKSEPGPMSLSGTSPGTVMAAPFGDWKTAAVLLSSGGLTGLEGYRSSRTSVAEAAAAAKAKPPRQSAPVSGSIADVLGAEGMAQLKLLQAKAQLLRKERESQPVHDVVVLRASDPANADSADVLGLSRINLGKMAKLVGPGTLPIVNVLRHLDGGLVVNASTAAVADLQRALPTLNIAPVTYAYPQFIRPLGEDLAEAELQVAPGTPLTKFSVRLRTAAGMPVAGVRIRTLLEWSGTNLAATTDAQGIAAVGIPPGIAEVCLIATEPEHTYWPVFVGGFKRSDTPTFVDITAHLLEPDSYGLMANYAPYDAASGQGVRVGVIDSGVGPHDLIKVTGGACFVTGDNALDHADNGIGHGTHVAGVIAAQMSPNGIYGLAPKCELYSYRVCANSGLGRGRASSVDIAAALERAIDDRCDLVNISMGSVNAQPEVATMLQRARANGVVVFSATGNDGQNALRYPAQYPGVMSVAALGRDLCCPPDCPETSRDSGVRMGSEFVTSFSNYGTGTSFIGPGLAVLSTFPQNRYAMMSGTSMATPFITGMAARLLGSRPDLQTLNRDAVRVGTIITELSKSTRRFTWPASYGTFGVLK